ncbi:MAG TPA: ABC transporter permease [Chloroflexota bacterium]|nr:ABC transporter permease [Chloroflexota bacterium]
MEVTIGYAARRIGVFLLIIVVAVTINFVMPRIRSTNPIEQRLYMMAGQGGVYVNQIQDMIKIYNEKFGLDKPLYVQYINYWRDLFNLDLGKSLAFYPQTTTEMILRAAPWTIGLLTVSTLIAFALGTVFGALMAWPRTSRIALGLSPLFMTLSAIPYYLLGMLFIYALAMNWRLLPVGAAYSAGVTLKFDWATALDIGRHAILPAASIVLAGIGSWALGMRAMMTTVLGEDYLRMAEANGLRPRSIFIKYALRNAMLPQITSLAISLAVVMSGAVLVEVIFGYPGVGNLLFMAIAANDYFVIQGISLFIILSIGVVLLALDLVYPLIDPRIRYRRG